MFKLSEAELDTMLMLWECKEPIRPSELLIRLNENGHPWTISTLQTLLARLLAKDAVTMTKQKRFHYYAPIMSREAFLAATAAHLKDRLSTYSPIAPVAAFVEYELLSKEELAEAKTLLEN